MKDAKADCISKASKLFEPKNAKHNTFIAHLSERKGLSEFWVGIHHRKENEAEGKDLFESCYNLNPFLATLQLGLLIGGQILVLGILFSKHLDTILKSTDCDCSQTNL